MEKARADYGQAEIKMLADRFGYDQDVHSLMQEWDDFKQYMSDHWMTKSCREVVRALTGFQSNPMKCQEYDWKKNECVGLNTDNSI